MVVFLLPLYNASHSLPFRNEVQYDTQVYIYLKHILNVSKILSQMSMYSCAFITNRREKNDVKYCYSHPETCINP